MLIKASAMDESLGMEYYVCDRLNLGDLLEFRKSSNTFKVFEVSLDGVKASPELCSEDGLVAAAGKYAHYVMCKEGVDTFYALQLLKKVFGGGIGYAGLKDSDSHSCQFISLNVKFLSGDLRAYYSLGHVKLCFHRFLNRPVRRGELLGNVFNIFLSLKRVLSIDEVKLREVEELLRSALLPNYYGYQRFGTIRPTTHLIGSAIVRGMWDEAVRLIAGSPHPAEGELVTAAREEFEAGNYGRALKLFPSRYWIERSVCMAMMRYGDPLTAIKSLPMEIRHFYVEAYQSYLFNKALSNALRALGSVEGVRERCETLVVPGTNVKLRNDVCQSSIRDVMESEGIGCEDFLVRELGVVAKGHVRDSTFKVKELSLRIISDGVWMEFMLPRGSYASIILREIFKEAVY